jgi:heat shock protein HslJ
MKRIFLILLILSIAIAACGGQDTTTPEPTEAPAVETEPTQAPPTEAPPTEVPPTEEPAMTEESSANEPAAEAGQSMVATMNHEVDPALVNITWEWIRRDPNGNSSPEILIENPQNYTLYFNEDGTFNATLDCNTGSGVYATEPPDSIVMELGPTTLAACPPESQVDDMITIFGGAVQNYELEDGDQTLVLAWAGGGPLDYYRNADAPEPGQAEVEGIPEDAIQLDLNGLATSYDWSVVPGSPIPAGPGGQGYPPHILLTFDGATAEEVAAGQLPYIYIFPTEAYISLYQAADNQTVADQVIRLGQLIATADGRTEQPDSPMPLLPPPDSFMDRWAQFLDLDFGVGEGVRYVSDSPNRQAIGVWSNDATGYYYQGLTTDQTFYVSMFWPVSTAALPNTAADATEEQTDAATNPDTYPAYKQETIDTLNALAPADWAPDLATLDAMAASLTFPLPGEGTDTEEPVEATPEGGAEATATPTPAAPATDAPTGTITAPDGVFVRSGPGTEYPNIDVAANGSTVNITGKSQDGQWWEIEVPAFLSETGTGWVSATWVEANNTGSIPVVEAPDLEAVTPSLAGVNWQWTSLTTPVEQTTVTDPTRYTIVFNTDGSAAIKADCNNVIASYTADGSAISITPGPSTLVACADDSLDQQFLASLSAAANYFFESGDLLIDMAADGGTMRFTAGDAAAPPAAGTPTPEATAEPGSTPEAEGPTSPVQGLLFSLVSYGPEGAEQSLIEGTQITATFAGGTVSGSAGCNTYTGTVTPVDDYFTIGGIATTQMACTEPEGVMEQEQAFLTALAATAGYQWQQDAVNGNLITGGRLFYSLSDGTTGYMNFVAQ